MNANSYKIIFSKHLGTVVAVGEHACAAGKAASGQACRASHAITDTFVGILRFSFATVALACLTLNNTQAQQALPALAATALPQGGTVNKGSVTISTQGAAMAINQTTDKASLNWQSFSIGSGAAVNVQQNNANSVLLNRVVGNDPSQIFGKLNANGQVILINPNGVVFGKGSSVTASAFTASTFGVTDADLFAGKHKFSRNGSTAGITVEDGATLSTTTRSGYVGLIAASVDNQGVITTKGGAVVLASGETVALPVGLTDNISVPLSGKVRLELLPSTINAMLANSGTITTDGGQVLMQAAALSDAVASVTHTGTIDTTGAQGGAVRLLADQGTIKVSGSITATSTATGNKGGDIIIGRDDVTGTLATSTDVSAALIESQGGFIETSAHQLTVDGATVKAANWLLDPDNIDITGDASAATAGYSKIKASDIATALNAGTSVTVATTAANRSNQPSYKDAAGTGAGLAVSGDGNILVNAAIVKSGANNASLTLEADNGITVNQRVGRGSADSASAGTLNVTMTALGNAATATNSGGLTLNNVIDANEGNVILNGTNKNTNSNSRGVTFANNSGITANTITVTGTATGSAEGNQGVFFTGTSSLRATGAGNSVISGISSSATGSQTSAVIFTDGANVTLDSGLGNLTVQGTHTVTGYGGIRFGAYGGSATNPSLTTQGNVTLGTQDASNTSLNAGFLLRNGLITADTGSLTIKGQATGTGIYLYEANANIKSNGGSITLNGVATTNGHGVYMNSSQVGTLGSGGDVTIIGSGKGANQGVQFNGGNVRVYGNNVTLNGTANTASGQTGYGFYSTIGPSFGNTITAAGNLSITGTLNGAGSGTAVYHASTNWQNLVNAYTAGSTLSITGTNNASASNTSNTIKMTGVQASAGGDLTVSATTNNAATNAIYVFSNSFLSGQPAPGYQGGASSFVSTNGNTILQSNQGSILVQDGVPNTETSTAITGKNVIIDNTGGTFTGGVFTAGSGVSTSATSAGVQISDSLTANDLHLASNATRRTITASDANGQIVLSGKSTGSASGYSLGVGLASTTSFVAPSTNLLGTSTASVGVYNTAAITTSKDLNITGVSTSQSHAQGGVTLNASITTGSTGKVDITATDAAGGSNWAYNQNSGVNINAGSGGVTINATGSGSNSALNILGNITTTGAVSLTGNAGTGGGNGINTSGNVGISGTSVTMNGTGGTTGGSGVKFNGPTNLTGISLIKGTATSANGIQIGSAITASWGDISIDGTSSSGNGIFIEAGKSVASTDGKITFKGAATGINGTGLNIGYNASISSSGDVELTGTTDANNRPSSGAFAGVYNAGTVSAKNITLNALATNTSADVLGYYGAGSTGNLVATNTLTATGESKGNGAGFYMIGGKVQSGGGMSVTGLSNTGSGIGLDSASTVSNSVTSGTATGNIVLTGSKNFISTNAAIFLLKANISNSANNGGVQLTASKGDISSKYGSANTTTITNNGSGAVSLSAGSTSSTEASAINGTNMTITQNGNGGVQVTTSGAGNVTAPIILNSGTSNVVVAAGTAIAAGDGSGGQVKTVVGNTITQISTGKTYIYTGNANDTGALFNLGGFNNGLLLSTIGTDTKNTASKTAHGGTISGGANTQVMFREKVTLNANTALNGVIITYGDNTDNATLKTALLAANPSTGSGVLSQTSNAGTFMISNSDIVTDGTASATSALSNSTYLSASGNLKASDAGYAIDVAGNNYNLNGVTATLKVARKSLSAIYAANNKVFDGGTNAIVTGALKDAIAGDAVTPNHSSATFESADVGNNKSVTVSGITLAGKDAANYKVDPVVNFANRSTTKANITAVTPTPPVPVVPTDNSSKVKIPTGSANPFALASAENLEDGTCTVNNIENCYCEASSVSQGVDICYEPKRASR